MTIPNLPTLIAAGVYSLTDSTKAWGTLASEEKKPFINAANFMTSYVSGYNLADLDRTKLAKALAAAAPDVEVDADMAVAVFVNLSTAM